MEEFTLSELNAGREHRNTYPKLDMAMMHFTNDIGDEVVKVKIFYEWEPLGGGLGKAICIRPNFKPGFVASEYNQKIDISYQLNDFHDRDFKLENIEFVESL